MRLLFKFAMKLVKMALIAALLGGVMRYARPYIMKSAGMPVGTPGVENLSTPQFSSEESDLMGTVFKCAIRMFTGQGKRDELAAEINEKLYGGKEDAETKRELGIEMVSSRTGKPMATPPVQSAPVPSPLDSEDISTYLANNGGGGNVVAAGPLKVEKATQENGGIAKILSKFGLGKFGKQGAEQRKLSSAPLSTRDAMVAKIWSQATANPELAMLPVVLVGMMVVGAFRKKRSPDDGLMLPSIAMLDGGRSGPYDMKNAVHKLKAEHFELLVALIYERQGYRVSMPAGLNGGRGGDFTLSRKLERLLVQCKNSSQKQKLPVERVRELREAVFAAGATRGLYVTSCDFTWDARYYAKANSITLIDARTLDDLLSAAKESPQEDLMSIAQWAPKFMGKVKLTAPFCPACEAEMEELILSNEEMFLCSRRPECRGRRTARQFRNAIPVGVSQKRIFTPSQSET